MKSWLYCLQAALAGIALTTSLTASADAPIPITAEEAFDAVQLQVDPQSGDPVNVVLLDIRDPVEYFFSGAPAEVVAIKKFGTETLIEPDNGKVRLIRDGKFVKYRLNGRKKRLKVDKIESLETNAIAVHIAFWNRTLDGWDKTPAEDGGSFYPTVATLADNYDVLILYCRTGGRSTLAADGLDATLFWKVYEIDDPGENNKFGGFTGPNYYNVLNGQVGFPGRLTEGQFVPSVSWLDSGLPIVTTTKPIPVASPDD